VGENGSEVRLDKPATVKLTVKAAALLDAHPDTKMRGRKLSEKPYWHIERARIGESQTVPVEVLVNGVPVTKRMLSADGHTEDLVFDIEINKSSWVALRIFPSSHTNPVWVTVKGKPVREKSSLEWCLKSVDQCWSQKEKLVDAKEHDDAVAAYEHARQVYRARLAEAE
jgi:hypothetical protein